MRKSKYIANNILNTKRTEAPYKHQQVKAKYASNTPTSKTNGESHKPKLTNTIPQSPTCQSKTPKQRTLNTPTKQNTNINKPTKHYRIIK